MFGSDACGDDRVAARWLELLFEEGAEAQSRQLVHDDVLQCAATGARIQPACAARARAGTRSGISG
jgi:hypothetical protein